MTIATVVVANLAISRDLTLVGYVALAMAAIAGGLDIIERVISWQR